VNKKLVRRLYRLDGLQLRTRIRRRKHMCLHHGPVPVPSAPHERWSMDFCTISCSMLVRFAS
jgi:putative transposase